MTRKEVLQQIMYKFHFYDRMAGKQKPPPETGGGIFFEPTKIRWASQDWTLVQQ